MLVRRELRLGTIKDTSRRAFHATDSGLPEGLSTDFRQLANFCRARLTPGVAGVQFLYHLRSDSGSNGLEAKKLSPLLRSRPILLFHTFRYVGLAFLIPGVVSTRGLPSGFGLPGAYGDLIASILSFVCLALLRFNERAARVVIWLFSIQGTLDILSAMALGPRYGIYPGSFGAMYFIITVYVPAALVGHVLIFRLLLTKRSQKISPNPSAAPSISAG